jgi:hypothetical protein
MSHRVLSISILNTRSTVVIVVTRTQSQLDPTQLSNFQEYDLLERTIQEQDNLWIIGLLCCRDMIEIPNVQGPKIES